jgi:hypothetical protein
MLIPNLHKALPVGRNIMTPKLLILFLFAWTTAFTQTPATKESSAAKTIVADTLKAIKSDTISISKAQLVDKELRVIFEDTSKPDYFKYIFPILTLLLGVALNKFLDNIKDRKKIKKAGERWKEELAALELLISKQISYIEHYLQKQSIHNDQTKPFLIVSELSCEAFNVLDKSELIQYFQKSLHKNFKKPVFISGKIYVILTTLKSTYQDLLAALNTYTKEAIAAPDKIFDLLKMLIIELDVFKSSVVNLDTANDDITSKISHIEDLINEHVVLSKQLQDFDIFSLENKLYYPILSVFKIQSDSESVSKINSIIHESLSILSTVQTEHERLKKMMIYCKADYKEDLKNIEIVLQNFKLK